MSSLAFSFETKSPQRPRRDWIWTDNHLGLSLQGGLPPARLGHAVLRLKSSSAAAALLPPSTRYAPLGASLDLNLVLVPIDRIEQLDALAPMAHADTQTCGSIEFMPLRYQLSDQIDFAAPHFAASANFSQLPPLLAAVSLTHIDDAINAILTLPSRYHRDSVGAGAAATVSSLWNAQLKTANRWTIQEIIHTNTGQKSLVARLEGKSSETVILGAHLDSVARGNAGQLVSAAPGADDDASGLAILTEVLRLIELQGLSFERSIELHAYAAEEVGLIGSRELAVRYRQENRVVAGMIQFDMAYFSQGTADGIIHLLSDYSSLDLQRSAIEWIKRYMGPYYKRAKLPSGSASDHKSWWEQGYATLFPFEDPANLNPYIHTSDDQIAHFDSGLLIQRITQLALLFVSYQAGLSQLTESYQAQEAQLLPRDLPKDLYLANESKSEGQLAFWVSAPATAKTLEFCPIDTAARSHCTGERLTLSESQAVGTRQVFYSEELFAFAAGQKWRVMAYDAADTPIAMRQIEFSLEP